MVVRAPTEAQKFKFPLLNLNQVKQMEVLDTGNFLYLGFASTSDLLPLVVEEFFFSFFFFVRKSSSRNFVGEKTIALLIILGSC